MTGLRETLARRRQGWFGLKKYVKELGSYPIPHAILRLTSRFVPAFRTGRLPAPRGLGEVAATVDDATFTMLRPDRCEIAKELYWGHGRRPRAEDALALDVVARLARHADVFVDVGAYTGVFTLATTAANLALTAHAFEIVPAVADLLEQNLRRDGVADRVIVHREGVGDPASTMVVPPGVGGSALPSFYSSRMHFDHGVRVGFVALDSLSDAVPEDRRVVMKVDVEGTERAVFEHGAAFLARARPDILCEVLFERAEPDVLNTIFAPLGYSFYLVREHDLLAWPTIVPNRRFRDWLFSRRDAADLARLGFTIAGPPSTDPVTARPPAT
jgi:FkbM family methyltransferase